MVRQLIAGSVCQRQFWRILSDFEKNNYTFQLSAQGIHERRWIKLHDDTWGEIFAIMLELKQHAKEGQT